MKLLIICNATCGMEKKNLVTEVEVEKNDEFRRN